MLEIFVDADACPVKQETCNVAKRHGLNVTFVSNSRMRIPVQDGSVLVVVEGLPDAADDWIAGHVAKDDVVITADVPLAARCVKAGGRVLGATGRVFSDDNIGEALATRNLLSDLRGAGTITGGPPPFDKRDRSRFLQSLEQLIQDVKRGR
jgi:uncharacterized protein